MASVETTDQPAEIPKIAWFCLQAQPKHEHIAAGHLRQTGVAEVFLPRVRFKRSTRRGMVWVTEALFPGYLFARFNWQTALRQVHHAYGIRSVVHFGERWPTVPEDVIQDLRSVIGDAELHVIETALVPGDTVEIAEGSMRGLSAVVSRVMPGRDRVIVLLEFLGRQTAVELSTNAVIKDRDDRSLVLPDDSE